MPAKMASFSLRHAAGVAASMRVSSGPPRLSEVGMPPAGSNPSMKPWTRSRISLSGGRNDHALVSMRINERTRSGRARTSVMTIRPPMECPNRSTGPFAYRLEQGREVRRQLLDGVALGCPVFVESPCPRWSRVTTRRSAANGSTWSAKSCEEPV